MLKWNTHTDRYAIIKYMQLVLNDALSHLYILILINTNVTWLACILKNAWCLNQYTESGIKISELLGGCKFANAAQPCAANLNSTMNSPCPRKL